MLHHYVNIIASSRRRSFDPLTLAPALWLADTGSDASIWPDISGNARHGTQSTPAYQPSIIAAAQNGRQARRFDGVDDFLEIFDIGSLVGAGDFSLFFAGKPTGTITTTFRAAMGKVGDNPSFYWHVASGSYGFYYAGNRLLGPRGNTTPQLLSFFRSSNLWTGALNGVDGTSTITLSSAWASGVNLLGRESGAYYAQDLFEILLFPSFLSSENRQKIENYLNTKWSLY
jgi:hypothetical protein